MAVIVPSFNSGAYLEASLASVQAQTFPDWECIVVDDGSTDGTAEVADRFVAADPRFRLIRQRNRGTPVARNVGVAAASPGVEYLAFLDADDIWLPEALTALIDRLNLAPEAVGSYGLAEYIDRSGTPMRIGEHPAGQRDRRRSGRFGLTSLAVDEPYTFESLIVSGTIWPSAVALHRSWAVDRAGGFDPVMRQLQDWELYVRMSRFGPFVPLEQQVAWYRQHDTNATRRSDNVAFFTLLARWKLWQSPANSPRQRAESRRVWRRLSARWVVWSAQAALRSWRHPRSADARQAAAALALFTTGLLAGHPRPPDWEAAHLLATFVTNRSGVSSAT